MYKVGDRVVVKNSGRYRDIPIGTLGTVRSCYCQPSVAVELDGYYNARSGRGYYYFQDTLLSKVAEETNHTAKGVVIMEGNYRIVAVNHLTAKDTAWVCACFDEDLVLGDKCVVAIAPGRYALGEISMFMDKYPEDITCEVVCKVDFVPYKARLDLREKYKNLMNEMATRAASLQQLAIYKMLAEQDEQMKDTLARFMEVEKALHV